MGTENGGNSPCGDLELGQRNLSREQCVCVCVCGWCVCRPGSEEVRSQWAGQRGRQGPEHAGPFWPCYRFDEMGTIESCQARERHVRICIFKCSLWLVCRVDWREQEGR